MRIIDPELLSLVLNKFHTSYLSEREKYIIKARYGLGHSTEKLKLKEIGDKLSISASRVSQIEYLGLFKLCYTEEPYQNEINKNTRINHLPIISGRTLHALIGENITCFGELIDAYHNGKLINMCGIGKKAYSQVEILIKKYNY